MKNNSKTVELTGTALMAALVLVFDYTLKFSGLKIPFPPMPFIKFDFTGVPILLSYFLYGLPSAGTTSIIAALGIMMRSPSSVVDAIVKAFAEFSTALGVALGGKLMGARIFSSPAFRGISIAGGVLLRVVIMTVVNLFVLPGYRGVPFEVTVGMLPLLGLFNGLQGAISSVLGYIIFATYKRGNV